MKPQLENELSTLDVVVDVTRFRKQKFIGGVQQVFWNIFDEDKNLSFVALNGMAFTRVSKEELELFRIQLGRRKSFSRILLGSIAYRMPVGLRRTLALASKRNNRLRSANFNSCAVHHDRPCSGTKVRFLSVDRPTLSASEIKAKLTCSGQIEVVSYYHDSMVMTHPECVDVPPSDLHAEKASYVDFLEALREFDYVIPNSKFTREELKDVCKLLGIELKITRPAWPEALPSDLPPLKNLVSGGEVRVLLVGPWDYRKNFSRAFDALTRFKKEHPAVAISVIAVRPRSNSVDSETIASFRAADNVLRVKIKHYVPPKELDELYKWATLVLVPSNYEGFGLPAIQARKAGCNLIVSDKASLPEVASDLGYLDAVCGGDHIQWANLMNELKVSPKSGGRAVGPPSLAWYIYRELS